MAGVPRKEKSGLPYERRARMTKKKERKKINASFSFVKCCPRITISMRDIRTLLFIKSRVAD